MAPTASLSFPGRVGVSVRLWRLALGLRDGNDREADWRRATFMFGRLARNYL
jgi:hypothetical protein